MEIKHETDNFRQKAVNTQINNILDAYGIGAVVEALVAYSDSRIGYCQEHYPCLLETWAKIKHNLEHALLDV